MSDEVFVAIWQRAKTLADVARAAGVTEREASIFQVGDHVSVSVEMGRLRLPCSGTVRAVIDRTRMPGWRGGEMLATDPARWDYVIKLDDPAYGCALSSFASWVVEQAAGVDPDERIVMDRAPVRLW